MKIAISGIFYPMAMMHYFIRAFQRLGGVDLILVGPYTGNWIPWNGGMYLPQKYCVVPDVALPKEYIGKMIPFEYIKKMSPK